MKELHQEVSAKNKKIEELEHRLDAVQKATATAPVAKGPVKAETAKAEVKPSQPAAPAAQAAATGELKEQVEELKEQVGQVAEAQKQEFLAKYNPSIGFVGESIGAYRSRSAKYTNVLAPANSPRPGGWDFFQRSMELNVAGSVDPFARGYAVLNASADPVTGEAAVGVEEAAIVTTSLPWNLTLKGGRFFGEFGRLAYIHDHELPFVWRPLALDQYIGGESRTDGAQINWLLPFSHYVSLTAGVGDSFGGQPNNFGDFQDNRKFTAFNFWGRASTYFDLTPNIAIEPGFSWLFNPNATDRGGAFLQPDGSTLTERQRRLLGQILWCVTNRCVTISSKASPGARRCFTATAAIALPHRMAPSYYPTSMSPLWACTHISLTGSIGNGPPDLSFSLRKTPRINISIPMRTLPISPGTSATGMSCVCNSPIPHPPGRESFKVWMAQLHPWLAPCVPITRCICNGPGSSGHTPMGGKNANPGKEDYT